MGTLGVLGAGARDPIAPRSNAASTLWRKRASRTAPRVLYAPSLPYIGLTQPHARRTPPHARPCSPTHSARMRSPESGMSPSPVAAASRQLRRVPQRWPPGARSFVPPRVGGPARLAAPGIQASAAARGGPGSPQLRRVAAAPGRLVASSVPGCQLGTGGGGGCSASVLVSLLLVLLARLAGRLIGFFLLPCDLRAGHGGGWRRSAARVEKAGNPARGCRAGLPGGEVPVGGERSPFSTSRCGGGIHGAPAQRG